MLLSKDELEIGVKEEGARESSDGESELLLGLDKDSLCEESFKGTLDGSQSMVSFELTREEEEETDADAVREGSCDARAISDAGSEDMVDPLLLAICANS